MPLNFCLRLDVMQKFVKLFLVVLDKFFKVVTFLLLCLAQISVSVRKKPTFE